MAVSGDVFETVPEFARFRDDALEEPVGEDLLLYDAQTDR